jgi:hypothetical protein
MSFDSHQHEDLQKQASLANAEAVALPSAFELSELELSFPDDLQHLAEQLGEDALHLSALYPPRASQQWQVAAQAAAETAAESLDEKRGNWLKLSQRWMKPVMVAACLLVAVTLAWRSVPKRSTPESTPVISPQAGLKPASLPQPLDSTEISPTEISATERSANDPLLSYHPVVDQPADSSGVIGNVQTEQAMVPTGLFMTLSGPEQEAMLDLIEDAKLQQPSVSF